MTRIAIIIVALGGFLVACERVVDLTPPPDGSGGPDGSPSPDAAVFGDDGGAIDDSGILDADLDAAPIPDAP